MERRYIYIYIFFIFFIYKTQDKICMKQDIGDRYKLSYNSTDDDNNKGIILEKLIKDDKGI